jgi:thiol-disulfide isomerase/thioredoxin
LFYSNLPKIESETWINRDENLDLEGKIVLVDFFAYSCVNCLRTIPFLKQLERKYASLGLVIIGVHTPEFEFEKIQANVQNAIDYYKISWPVAIDNNLEIWHQFSNKYWPTKYLSNQNGKIVYSHIGEGNYLETENQIRSLLELEPISKEDYKLDDPLENNFCIKPTPETYLGYHRGKSQQDHELMYDLTYNYAKPEVIDQDRFALSGQFILMSEFVESVNFNSRIFLNFSATEVNLVVMPVNEQCTIELLINGEKVLKKFWGKDIQEDGKVVVGEAKMYNLLKIKEGFSGELQINAFEGNFRAFAFTFSGCN